MTEAEWTVSTEPAAMLGAPRPSERKLRLLAAAACRRIPHLMANEGCRRAVEAAERCVEGLPVSTAPGNWRTFFAELTDKPNVPRTTHLLEDLRSWPLDLCQPPELVEARKREQADLIRDVFAPAAFRSPPQLAAVQAWNDGVIPRMAAAAYDHHLLPSGHLDHACLAVLADALEELGGDAVLLNHLRQQGGVHVRGCWVVDLLLSKE